MLQSVSPKPIPASNWFFVLYSVRVLISRHIFCYSIYFYRLLLSTALVIPFPCILTLILIPLVDSKSPLVLYNRDWWTVAWNAWSVMYILDYWLRYNNPYFTVHSSGYLVLLPPGFLFSTVVREFPRRDSSPLWVESIPFGVERLAFSIRRRGMLSSHCPIH